jgi:steroid 5-alpha reductase family enzyme
MQLWIYLIIALGINLVMFIPAFLFKTDKLTDASYAITFLTLVLIAFLTNPITLSSIILTLMVLLWSLRLGIFLLIRIWNMKRDKRFDGMRESFWRFLKFWTLQGLAVWIIMIPALLMIGANSQKIFWLGLGIWIVGLTIETIADIQKYRFNQNNKGAFIQSGLWRYSRHPNYFGEILCWVGIYTAGMGILAPAQLGLGLLSPVFIIVLLVYVTGIPPLEKYAEKKWGAEYKKYQKNTSSLVIWFRK